MTMSEQIIAALQKSTDGLTSKELAEVIGKQRDSVSACAYKMFIAGKVQRNSERQVRQMVCDTWRWHSKE
jgi:hypothetical protein